MREFCSKDLVEAGLVRFEGGIVCVSECFLKELVEEGFGEVLARINLRFLFGGFG